MLAGGDGEFLVGVGEVPFDGPGGDEQVLGDVAVGQADGGELGDAALAGCQRVESAQDEPSGSPAGGDEFGTGSLRQRDRPAATGEVECDTEDVPAFCSLSGAPEGGPQVGDGAGVFPSRGGALEYVYRLAELFDAAATYCTQWAPRARERPRRCQSPTRSRTGPRNHVIECRQTPGEGCSDAQ